MSIYGEQWWCQCGWANVFVRTRCRNCNAVRELATVATENADDVVQRTYEQRSPQTQRVQSSMEGK